MKKSIRRQKSGRANNSAYPLGTKSGRATAALPKIGSPPNRQWAERYEIPYFHSLQTTVLTTEYENCDGYRYFQCCSFQYSFGCLMSRDRRLLPPPRRLCFSSLFVCLSVSSFAQKLLNGCSWNFQGRLVGSGPMNKRSNFGGDPDHVFHGSGSVSRHW